MADRRVTVGEGGGLMDRATPSVKIVNPIRLQKLTKVMQIRGADTYVHWTVFAVAAFILAGVISHPGLSLLGLICYFAVLLIHETGHMIAAQRKGCRVECIELYPIFAVTRFEVPWSRLDHCFIAWGGVIAQALVFIPLIGWVATHGYTSVEEINMVLAILGFFSFGVAIFNLLPIPPLDGAMAWQLFPELLAERRRKIPRKPTYR
jgi:Zn-dependent protease